MAGTRAKKRSRLWFDLHSWMGMKLSLFMSFILITGTLAVFSNEMDWLSHASMRVTPQPKSERASWGEIYDAASARYPDWTLQYLTEPIDPWFTASMFGLTETGARRLIDVNPYTAEVTGDRNWLSFHRFFRNTHRHLMLPVQYGVPLVSLLSFLLLGSMVTGLVVYKKFWRGFFRKPRTRNGRILNGDLHRLAGLWTLWFIPIIMLTSFFYLAESLGWSAPAFGETDSAATVEHELTGAEIDAMAERAREHLPGLDIAVVLPPASPGDPLVFQGYTDGTWLVRPRASYVAFDPATGEALGQHRSGNANLHQRISEMADPLHFGYFGGLWTKIIWFVFGAAMSALSVTGVIIYGKRLIRPARSAPAANTAHVNAAPWYRIVWQGMGWWKWLGIIAVVISLCLTPLQAQGADKPPPGTAVHTPASMHRPHR